jgi:hypothetical protein
MNEHRCGCVSIERKIFSTADGGTINKWFCSVCGTEFSKVKPVRTYEQILDVIAVTHGENGK